MFGQLTNSGTVKPTNTTTSKEDKNISLIETIPKSTQTSPFDHSFGTSKPTDCGSKTSTQQQNTQTSPFDHAKIAFDTSKPMDCGSKTSTQPGFSEIKNTSLFGTQQKSAQTSPFGQPNFTFGTSKSMDCDSKIGAKNTPFFGIQQQNSQKSPFGNLNIAIGTSEPMDCGSKTSTQPGFSEIKNTSLFGTQQKSAQTSPFGQSNTAFGTSKPMFCDSKTNTQQQSTETYPFGHSKVAFGSAKSTGFDLETKKQAVFGNSAFRQLSANFSGLTSLTCGNGTMLTKYQPLVVPDIFTKENIKHQCITAMKEYEGKSLEELRMADYLMNSKWSYIDSNKDNPFSQSAFSKLSECGSSVQTTPIFGSTQPIFGKTTLGGAPGTAFIKYRPSIGTDNVVIRGTVKSVNTKHHCITTMTEYSRKSIEELRLEDYLFNQELHWKGIGKNLNLFGGIRPENRFDCRTGFTGCPQITINQTPSMFGQQNQTMKIDFGSGISFLIQQIPQTKFSGLGQSNANVFGFGTPQISFSQTPSIFGQQNQIVKIDFGDGASFLIQKLPQTKFSGFGQSYSNVFGFETPQISFSQTPSTFGQQNQTVKIDFGSGISFLIQQIPQTRFGGFGQSNSNVFGFETPQICFTKTASMFGQQNQIVKIDFGRGISFLIQQIPQTRFGGFGQSNSNVIGFETPQISFSQTPSMFGKQNQDVKIDFVGGKSFFIQQVPQTRFSNFGQSSTSGNINTSTNRFSFGLDTKKNASTSVLFGNSPQAGFGFDTGTNNTFGSSNNFQTQPTVPSESGFGFGQTKTTSSGSIGNNFGAGQTFGSSNNFQTQPTVNLESGFGFGQTKTTSFGSIGNNFGAGQTFGSSNNFQTQPTVNLESGFGQTKTTSFGSIGNNFGAGQTFGSSNNFQTQPTVNLESGFGFGQTKTTSFGSIGNNFGAGQTFGSSNNFQTQPTVNLESGFDFGQTKTTSFGSTGNNFEVGQTFGTNNTFGSSNNFQIQPTVPLESGFCFGQTNTSGFGSNDNKFGFGQKFGTNNTFGSFQQQSTFLNRQPNVTLKISPDGIEIINFQLI